MATVMQYAFEEQIILADFDSADAQVVRIDKETGERHQIKCWTVTLIDKLTEKCKTVRLTNQEMQALATLMFTCDSDLDHPVVNSMETYCRELLSPIMEPIIAELGIGMSPYP